VELASGEIGIVVAHGQRANLPPVAAMVSASDNVNVEPVLRETRDRRFAVKAAVPPQRITVHFQRDDVSSPGP
jgi:hypothetical protein